MPLYKKIYDLDPADDLSLSDLIEVQQEFLSTSKTKKDTLTKLRALLSHVRTVNASDDLTLTDAYGSTIVNMTTGGVNRTVTLPTLADNQGVEITLVNADGLEGSTLKGEGAEQIATIYNSYNTYTIENQYEILKVKAVGSVWIIEKCPADVAMVGEPIWWHKDLTGISVLPTGIIEYSGTPINDLESPLNGETLEDPNGDDRFIRASGTSGTEQDSAMWGHYHNVTNGANNVRFTGSGSFTLPVGGNVSTDIIGVAAPITDGVHGAPNLADESRPPNISMVLCIRIK